jgi:DNA-binding transcriptional LysR family regulator
MQVPLDRGELDLAIGSFDDIGERFAAARLLEDSLVMAMRHDHPALTRELTPQVVAALEYLEISSTGEGSGCIDDWLATHGLTRRIAHCAPRLSAAAILSSTELIAVLSRRLGEHWVQTYGVSIRELPFASPMIAIGMIWHRRFDTQPAHLWLRKLVQQTAESR